MNKIKETPHYKKLKGVIPEDVLIGMIERDIVPYMDSFEKWIAQSKIPEVILQQIFSPEMEKRGIRLSNFLGRWGNLSVEAVSKLCLIMRHLEPQVVFEIGTYNGTTILQLAMNSKHNCHLYTLDLPPGYQEHGMSEIDTYMFQKLYDGSCRRYERTYWARRITQLYGDSTTFDFSPYYGKVDLMLIDGAHDYETKKLDTENALKMLSPQGVLIWDNYDDVGCPFVTKFLTELDLPLSRLKNTNLVVYRKS